MNPSKPLLDESQDDEYIISDIAQIFKKLSKNEYQFKQSQRSQQSQNEHKQSIFPPLSIKSSISGNYVDDFSRSNSVINVFKRNMVNVQIKKFQIPAKKIKHQQQDLQKQYKFSFNQKFNQKQDNSSSLSNQQQKNQLQLNHKSLSNYQSRNIVKVKSNKHVLSKQNYKITDYFTFSHKLSSKNIQKIDNQKDFQVQSQKQSKKQSNLIREQENLLNQSFSSKTDPKNYLKQQIIQKNEKKRQNIQKLKAQILMIREQKQELTKKLMQSKQKQKSQLKQQILLTNQYILSLLNYKKQSHQYLSESSWCSMLKQVQTKLCSIKQYKQKCNKKVHRKQIFTDQQSLRDQQNSNQSFQVMIKLPDKRTYLTQWMSKLDKFRDRLTQDHKYLTRIQNDIQPVQQQLKQLISGTNRQLIQGTNTQLKQGRETQLKQGTNTQLIQGRETQLIQGRNTLQDYALLGVHHKTTHEQIYLINAFNTQTVLQQQLTLIRFPKFIYPKFKQKIQKTLNNLMKLSIKLCNSASHYFLQSTLATIGINNDFLIYGTESNRQNLQGLAHALHKYQGFSQAMIRHITRICIMALQQIKIKADLPCFLLPKNVHFTKKYDVKFSNILFNNLYFQTQLSSLLKQNFCYYFISPEAHSQHNYQFISAWSLGILVYFMAYQKFPFQYESEKLYDDRDMFFLSNPLLFVNKTGVSQKLKDFITICLTQEQKDVKNLLKHPFFYK